MTLSFKILKFNYFANSFINFVSTPASVTRYGFTTLQVTAATDFLTKLNLDMIPYVDPLLNNSRTIETIHEDYQNGYTLIQGMRGIIKNNTTITLTSDERAILNINKPDTTHSGAGIPKGTPALTCLEQKSLSMVIAAMNSLTPFKRAKGEGIDAIGIKTAITAAGAPAPKIEDYIRQDNETTSEFEMLFTSSQVGKTLYIIGFYINSRNEAGKDGIPYIITII